LGASKFVDAGTGYYMQSYQGVDKPKPMTAITIEDNTLQRLDELVQQSGSR
jgi:hypothetical protein